MSSTGISSGWMRNCRSTCARLWNFCITGAGKSAALNLEWKEIDMQGRTARLKIEDSKNSEPWVLPLAGRLWEIIQERAKARRLDCVYVFHDGGNKIGDFRKAWQSACVAAGLGAFLKREEGESNTNRQRKKYAGLIIHDLRRCAARNLSRAGVSEVVAMKITGTRRQACIVGTGSSMKKRSARRWRKRRST